MATWTGPGGPRTSFRSCRIGLPEDGTAGWLVIYAGHILAVLSSAEDGAIVLAAGFREPFVCITMDWPDLAAARADFNEVGRMYRAGVVPAMIELRTVVKPGR